MTQEEIMRRVELLSTAKQFDRDNPIKIVDGAFDRVPERVRIQIEWAKNQGRCSTYIMSRVERGDQLLINTLNNFGYNACRDVVTFYFETHKECRDVIRIEW